MKILIFFLVQSALSKKELIINNSIPANTYSELERKILNYWQKHTDFSVDQFKKSALELGIKEEVLLESLRSLKERGVITRVGPFFNMDKSSGYVSLVAMKVDEKEFEQVKEIVNSFEEVAHNYRRNHEFNMWFVVAGTSELEVLETLNKIEKMTKCKTYNLPKLREFSLDLYLEV